MMARLARKEWARMSTACKGEGKLWHATTFKMIFFEARGAKGCDEQALNGDISQPRSNTVSQSLYYTQDMR